MAKEAGEDNSKPLVIITGASGDIGTDLCQALRQNYLVIGLDLKECRQADESYKFDLTEQESVNQALQNIKKKHGDNIAAIVHLAAYFDFSGEEHPLYEKVTIEGTRRLLKALADFNVGRFIYSSTMLVHAPEKPGEKISEKTPLKPGWIYPHSKAEAEKILKQEHRGTPYTILRLAGVYDEKTAVPTLAHQIARIYERDFKSHLYSGDLKAGQAFLHKDDMVDLFRRTVEKRNELPKENIMLAGEDEVMNYQELQNRIGRLIFGEKKWSTFVIPEFIAKPAAWLEEKAEPVIPDSIDHGEKPFIRPFMIDLASDHYDLDISQARDLLDWEPEHYIYKDLQALIQNLKDDPAGWYKANKIIPPDWIGAAAEKKRNPDEIRRDHEAAYSKEHREGIWAHFLNIGLALWLLTAPTTLGYESQALIWSDVLSGIALFVFACLSLSWRFGFARYVSGAIGVWLLTAPLVFWAPTAAAYMNDTLIGALVIGFSLIVRPFPGISPTAAQTGPLAPKGWPFSPSSWFQRMPIIVLAFIGFFISRYLTAYQLGHIDSVWEPFFQGAPGNEKNGTEEIITSWVSEAWPVPDAGLGAMTYALEILTGLMGSAARWRTMPWLVMLFGFMIVPLGGISIFFIIIQPVWLGTWCTLCLIAALAMLIQIPYSFDELVATGEFLYRRKKQGRPVLKIFFTGDTDEGEDKTEEDNFAQSPPRIFKDIVSGGVSLPWSLGLCILIGIWLMLTRLTLGVEGTIADADHLIGALVITIAVTSLAEVVRPVRFLIIPFGIALLAVPFIYGAPLASMISSLVCGVALILFSLRRGKIYNSFGTWSRFIK